MLEASVDIHGNSMVDLGPAKEELQRRRLDPLEVEVEDGARKRVAALIEQ